MKTKGFELLETKIFEFPRPCHIPHPQAVVRSWYGPGTVLVRSGPMSAQRSPAPAQPSASAAPAQDLPAQPSASAAQRRAQPSADFSQRSPAPAQPSASAAQRRAQPSAGFPSAAQRQRSPAPAQPSASASPAQDLPAQPSASAAQRRRSPSADPQRSLCNAAAQACEHKDAERNAGAEAGTFVFMLNSS